MKCLLICLIFYCLCFCTFARPQENIKRHSDTITVEKTIDRWVDSLNRRNFSEDIEKLQENVKDFTDKTKKSIERNIPKVKKLFKELRDYLKR